MDCQDPICILALDCMFSSYVCYIYVQSIQKTCLNQETISFLFHFKSYWSAFFMFIHILDPVRTVKSLVCTVCLYPLKRAIGFFHVCDNGNSCTDVYSYSCLHPLSNERKSMFKSGDSRAVWTWVWTWKNFKWALHYLHDVIYGKHCGPDWSFRQCFCSRKRCVLLWRCDVRMYTADAILFNGIQCKKIDSLMF